MGIYYPQCVATLRVIWEDFNLKSEAKLQKVYTFTVIPKRANVNINDYRQADTFDMEIDYKFFPFDPRTIRACGITIHMQDMEGLGKTLVPERANTVFIGFADKDSINLNETTRTVKLEGRDLTSVLIDRKFFSTLDTAQSLQVVIEKMIAELPELASITVVNRSGQTLPSLAAYNPQLGKANKLGTLRNSAQDESYWDAIQDLVSQAGLIAYMELDQLIISRPRVLYGFDKAKQFVYGKNIKSLEFSRQLGRKKNFNIAVRSLSTAAKEVITAQIPAEATAEWSKETGIPNKKVQIPTVNADGSQGEAKDAPLIGFLIPNVSNKTRLIEIGQELYEELGRQQLDGSLSTNEFLAVDGKDSVFDLLKLRNGTPISISLDHVDLKGLNSTDSPEKKRQFLIARGYPNSVAVVLSETLSRQQLDSPFYTKAVQFQFDGESGIQFKIDFVNFIQVPKRLANG